MPSFVVSAIKVRNASGGNTIVEPYGDAISAKDEEAAIVDFKKMFTEDPDCEGWTLMELFDIRPIYIPQAVAIAAHSESLPHIS